MRLLRAETAKLRRPLTWGVLAAAPVFCVLLALGGAHNAEQNARGVPGTVPACGRLDVPAGPQCGRVRALERARVHQILAGPAQVAAQVSPAGAGAEAAGLIASLPGALALALLGGGHAGGEWSGRTMKNVLTQCGHRWRVLGAKLVSLWLAGAGLMAACWATLATTGPLIGRLTGLPAPHVTAGHELGLALSQCGRALLVIAVFAAICVLAAVVTRTTIGTTAAMAGTVIALLALASLPGTGRWSPATWVQGWMRFPAGLASITPLPANFWSRFISAGGAPPGQWAGLAGLVMVLLVVMLVAGRVFARADIRG
jgi:ABC-type transport system involved in multi-copper enzyme maturation permease subunit